MRSLLCSASLLAALSVPLFAGDTTIILQNGLHGYTGCEDATLYNDYYDSTVADVNFGDSKDLKILFGKIDSGTTIDKNR